MRRGQIGASHPCGNPAIGSRVTRGIHEICNEPTFSAQPLAAAFIAFLYARTWPSDWSSTMSATDLYEPSTP